MPPREPHHHRGRHAPDFDDAASTPSTIQPDAAAADGTAAAPARADHTHAIVADAPSSTLGGTSSNSEGASTSFARADHSHDVGTAAPSLTLSTTNSEGSSNTLLRTDATVAAFDATTPATLNTDGTGAVGSAGTAARRDHKHPLPSTLDTNARVAVRKNSTGSAVGTRRQLNLIEGSNVTLTVADDSGNEEVDVTIAASSAPSFATPALTLGTSNSGGAASTVIRSDATIAAFDATTPAALSLGGSGATGSAGTAARRDHTHAVTVPQCRATRAGTSTQSIGTGSNTPIAFTTEDYDTDTMHDNATNNTRVTFTTAGKYALDAAVEFDTSATGTRGLHLRVNGTTYIVLNTVNAVSANQTYMNTSTQYTFGAGDYVEAIAYQNSGGSLNICPNQAASLVATRIG